MKLASDSFFGPVWVQALLLAVVVGATFSPVWEFELLRWDDDIAVTQNELIKGELNVELIGRWSHRSWR